MRNNIKKILTIYQRRRLPALAGRESVVQPRANIGIVRRPIQIIESFEAIRACEVLTSSTSLNTDLTAGLAACVLSACLPFNPTSSALLPGVARLPKARRSPWGVWGVEGTALEGRWYPLEGRSQ